VGTNIEGVDKTSRENGVARKENHVINERGSESWVYGNRRNNTESEKQSPSI